MIIFVRIKVRPEKRQELSQTLLSITQQVRRECGCLHSGFYQDIEQETDYLVVEEWETQKDSDEHLRSDIFKVLLGTGHLMQRPPKVVIHTVDHSTEWKPCTQQTMAGNDRE